jgi:hypothetical protein
MRMNLMAAAHLEGLGGKDMSILRLFLADAYFLFEVLSHLSFQDVANLLRGVPEVWPLFTEETTLVHRLGSRGGGKIRLRKIPMTLATFMAHWHWDIHCLDYFTPNFPEPRYEFPTDCFRPLRALPTSPSQSYQTCAFLPPGAPSPFGCSLLVVDRFGCLKILLPGAENFSLVGEMQTGGTVFKIAISPGGRTCLVFSHSTKIFILRMKEGGTVDTIITRITTPCSSVSDYIFDGEDKFILMDRNWDFWRYHFPGGDDTEMTKTMLHTPDLFCDIIYLEKYGKVLECMGESIPWRGLSYAFCPAVGREERGVMLLWTACNCSPGFTHNCQVVIDPSEENLAGKVVLHLQFQSCHLVEVLCDPKSRLVYFLVLSSLPESLFYKFPPAAHLAQPARKCDRKNNLGDYTNLGIFSANLSDLTSNSSALSLRPLFFAPSRLCDLELQRPRESAPRRSNFTTTFGMGHCSNYRAALTRLFIVVKTSETGLLCFPLLGEERSHPLAIFFGRCFQHFAATPDMMYLCCLPSDWNQLPIPLRLSTMCPEAHCFLTESSCALRNTPEKVMINRKLICFF